MKLEEARNLVHGTKVKHGDTVYDFGYVSQTGSLILYVEGEMNMQDSVAVAPREVELACARRKWWG